MESASQSNIPPEEPSSRLSSLLGFVVAVLTLTFPVLTIAHFSSARVTPLEPIPNPSLNLNE